jgi:iron complex outermembrane recepter protein
VRGYARGGFTILNDGRHEQFTQEVKLNGKLGGGLIDYVAGVYYIDERNRTDLADLFSTSPTSTLLLGDRLIRNTTSATAGYLQVDVHPISALTLTAGVRYTDETKTYLVSDNRPVCNAGGALPATCLDNTNLIAPSGVRIPTRQNVRLWTPRFAVNFKPNDDVLLFASATRGFKSGGWNARATNPAQMLPFDPEKVWSYEAGIKSDLFDRRVRVNLTAFRLDVSDLQILAGLLNTTTGALTFLTRNFADYRNTGVEAEFQFAPVDGLNLYANVGYQNDKYIVKTGQPAVDVYGIQSVSAQQAACIAALAAGKIPGGPNTPATQPSITACAAGIVTANGGIATPVRTPDWSLSLGGSYAAPLGGSMTLVPSVNASYRSKQEVAIANLSLFNAPVTGVNGTFPANPNGNGAFITGSQSPAAWLINAGVTLNGPAKRWSLSLDCNNCFDKAFIQSALSNYSYLNPPRTWMARGRVNF